MNTILRSIPFIVVIGLNVLAQAAHYRVSMLEPYIHVGASILIVNLLITLFLKKRDYFVYGISGVALSGFASVFVFTEIGQFYLEHIIEGLYFGMFLMATVPLTIGVKPFTFSISAKKYPQVIVNSNNFLKLNNLMSAIWAFLLLYALLLQRSLIPMTRLYKQSSQLLSPL